MLSQDRDGLYMPMAFKKLFLQTEVYVIFSSPAQLLIRSLMPISLYLEIDILIKKGQRYFIYYIYSKGNKMANITDDAGVVEPIFNQLRKNFKTNQTKDVTFRKDALKNLLRGYKQMREQFDDALKKDLGYNSFMATFAAHSIFEGEAGHILSNFQSWAKSESISTPVGLGLATCELQQEPLGVALVISAWNYPIYTALPLVAYAIAAGNAVILKPSQVAGYTSNSLAKLFNKYMDSRFYRVIQGKVQVAKTITKLPFDIICFTGSTSTGRLVAMQAAKNLTPCILELGGKCPVIVDQSAKVESAVMRILFGKYFNCGQTCIGVDYVYVHQNIKNEFKLTLIKKAQEFYGNGQNLSEQGNYGKIINSFHVQRLTKLIKDDHQGQIIFGGQIDQSKDFISPTIIWQPKKSSAMMQQEIFGPILPVFTYSNIDQVIQQINNKDKPLVVYHFSQDKTLIQKVRNSTSSGAYTVNDTVVQMLNSQLPFGGVGKSGYGRFHGKTGLLGFSNPKSICKTKAINSYPLNVRFPPYNDSKKNVINMLVKFGSITYGQIFKVIIAIIILIAVIVGASIVIPSLTGK